jgi:hypothetical protein
MCARSEKPYYNFLYGESYLLNLGTKLKFLDELESLFIVKKEKQVLVRRNYRIQTQCVTDISEKIGFLYLALDYIKQLEGKGGYSSRLIKYHFYNFVYGCKACLDSIAVLLNQQLNLGFKGGDRDLRRKNFRLALETKSTFFKDFSSKFGSWCDAVVAYRDRIIHQIGVPVFQATAGHPDEAWKPSLPHCIPKRAISYVDFLSDIKVEYVEIVTFCQDSVKNIMSIAENALAEIYDNIRGVC